MTDRRTQSTPLRYSAVLNTPLHVLKHTKQNTGQYWSSYSEHILGLEPVFSLGTIALFCEESFGVQLNQTQAHRLIINAF